MLARERIDNHVCENIPFARRSQMDVQVHQRNYRQRVPRLCGQAGAGSPIDQSHEGTMPVLE